MKQRIFLLTLLFLLILTRTNDISAKETKLNEDMFTNVENTLKDKEIDLSYTQLVKQLIHGNVKGVLHTIKAKMKEVFLNRMLIQKDLIREILLIAFTAAIFKNLSDSFFQQSTANSAFYITYVILCGVMVHSFFYLNKTVTQLVTLMADYMKGMIMAYSLAVVSTSGITTSTTVYEFYLLLIYAMTTLTNVVLLPMIKILFVLKIINHISKEEHFSRLCKTLEGVIKFLLKGFLSVLLGVQLIQSMILPAVDSMKNTVLQKGMSAIPGIGSGLNSAMTMVIGSAVVIKNSIGAVGILVLIMIIVPPVIEITAVVLTYLLAGIMLDDVSNYTMLYQVQAVKKDGTYHKGMAGFAKEQHIVQVPLAVLTEWDALYCPQNEIYIVENPSVFAMLCGNEETDHKEKAYMCMNGQPRLAGLMALDLLAKSETRVYYAGDLDPEGVLIAQKLSQYYKGEFYYWHMEAADYERCRSKEVISPKRLKILERITDERLKPVAALIGKYRTAGYQEMLAEDML